MSGEKSVLIVEDDAIMLGVYRQWLLKWLRPSSGVTVQFAVTGLEAEVYLKARRFDLTFLDLVLPGISGVELAREYRESMGYLVIASAFPEYGGPALMLAEQVMTKPFSEADFVAVLTSTLQRSVKNVDKGTGRSGESIQTI